MKWTHDGAADALYVEMSDAQIDRTVELDDGTIVDLDIEGRIVGVEILALSSGWSSTELSESFDLSPYDLHALEAITHVPPVASVGSSTHAGAPTAAATRGGVLVASERSPAEAVSA